MRLQLLIITACLLTGASYALGRYEGRKLAEGEAALAERIAEKAAKASREAAASAISQIRVRHQVIHNQLEREVRNVPVYSDPNCRLSADGMRNLNAALAGSVASHSELPASGATR